MKGHLCRHLRPPQFRLKSRRLPQVPLHSIYLTNAVLREQKISVTEFSALWSVIRFMGNKQHNRKPILLRRTSGKRLRRYVGCAESLRSFQEPPRNTRGTSPPVKISLGFLYLFRHHSRTYPIRPELFYHADTCQRL